MATSCGLPQCRSRTKLSNKEGQEGGEDTRRFKGPCGLPDCRNEAAAGTRPSRGQKEPKDPKLCDIPGCRDIEAREGNDVLCLYKGARGNKRSPILARAGDAYQLCVATWKKIQTDPYCWSLFKSIVFFVLGLKLFHDMTLPVAPKCRKRDKD